MKKSLLLLICFLVLSKTYSQNGIPLYVQNTSSSNSITCATPTIGLVASSTYTAATVNYVWSSTSTFVTSDSITVTTPGNYTLTATAGSLTSFTVVSIGVNTLVPVSALSPSVQNITCLPQLSAQMVTLSAVTPTNNMLHEVLSPLGGTFSIISFTMGYTPPSPGTYTYVLSNNINGCKTIKNFTVTSNQGFPTFSLTSSPPNFTLGCLAKSVFTMNIIGATTTTGSAQIPTGGATNYTLLPPSANTTVLPSGLLGILSNFTVNTPGNYTVVVRDVVTGCDTRLPVGVNSNTAGPSIDNITISNSILTCSVAQTTLKAFVPNQFVSYNWLSQTGSTTNTLGISNSVTIGMNTSLPLTATVNGIYTLTVRDPYNLCSTNTVIAIYKNTFPPKASISNGGFQGITCSNPTVVLTNISHSSVPPIFQNNLPVIGLAWYGPSPQASLGLSSTYTASTPGVYTLTAQDLNNGCTSNTTIVVSDNRNYPPIQNPVGDINILCPNSTALLSPTQLIQGSYTYSWTIPAGVSVPGPVNTKTLLVNAPGIYTLDVKDVLSGCVSSASFVVVVCAGIADKEMTLYPVNLIPNPAKNSVEVNSTLNMNGAEFRIWDLNGKLVKSQTLLEGNKQIKLNELQPGIYFVTIRSGNLETRPQKLIKE